MRISASKMQKRISEVAKLTSRNLLYTFSELRSWRGIPAVIYVGTISASGRPTRTSLTLCPPQPHVCLRVRWIVHSINHFKPILLCKVMPTSSFRICSLYSYQPQLMRSVYWPAYLKRHFLFFHSLADD